MGCETGGAELTGAGPGRGGEALRNLQNQGQNTMDAVIVHFPGAGGGHACSPDCPKVCNPLFYEWDEELRVKDWHVEMPLIRS